MRKVILILAAIVALVGILSYAFHVWFMLNYGAGPQKVPSAILDVDRNFNFPKNFPPDPGAEGRKTIQGIDSDHDGVRDDVQRWIYAFAPNEPKKQMALRQKARYFQDSLQDDYNLDVRKKNDVLLDRAIDCFYQSFDDQMHGYMEDLYLKAKILNTYARTVRYWENDNKVTTEEMSRERPKYEQPCDNR